MLTKPIHCSNVTNPPCAALTGNGNVSGVVTVSSGGKLSPGGSIGKIILSNSPVLQGVVIMEISKNGSALTNDQVQVTGTLTYGGSLIVTDDGSARPVGLLFAGSSTQTIVNRIDLVLSYFGVAIDNGNSPPHDTGISSSRLPRSEPFAVVMTLIPLAHANNPTPASGVDDDRSRPVADPDEAHLQAGAVRRQRHEQRADAGDYDEGGDRVPTAFHERE